MSVFARSCMLTVLLAVPAASYAVDPLTVSVADATFQPETNGGVGLLSFPVTLAAGSSQIPSGTQVSVIWSTGNGTATGSTGNSCGPGFDFISQQQVALTLSSFAPVGQINVPICGDGLDEPNEAFTVVLSPVGTGFTITDGNATGTIVDDDPTPTITVAASSGNEGNAVGSTLPVNLTLSAASGLPVQVSLSAAAVSGSTATSGTACGGNVDFLAGTTQVQIPANNKTFAANVPVCGDTAFEPNETFRVTLSNPQNATLGSTTSATATITNDDPAPANLTVADASVAESLVSTKTMTFRVSLTPALPVPTPITYRTVDGTAKSTGPGTGPWPCGIVDYFSKNNATGTIPASGSLDITVTVCNDKLDEPNETFFLDVTSATGVAITDGRGVGTIVDAPSLTLP